MPALALAFAMAARAAPFTLADSEVVDLPTAANGVNYQLYLHVPPACHAVGAPCPVLYMLDAEYSFALAAQIATHLTDRSRIPPLISVAIGYSDKSHYRQSRTRDYTPFFVATGGYGAKLQKVSGGGPAFLEVIRTEIIPYVEGRFGAAGARRTLIGHSYGGLFAIQAWIAAPDLFDNYIVVSPSLWYGDRAPLAAARKACASGPNGASRSNLFLAVGSGEEQPQTGRAMVSDLQALQAIFKDCAIRPVASALRVFDGETHASIFPTALSTGIRYLFQ